MPRRPLPAIRGWLGFDNTTPADLLRRNVLAGGKNLVMDAMGAWSKRPGVQKVGPDIPGTGSVPLGLAAFRTSDQQTNVLITGRGTQLVYGDGTTWTAFLTSLTADKFFDAVVYNDEIILVNGTDAPKKWTGAGNGVNLGGSPGIYAGVALYKERIWGFRRNSSRLDFSAIGSGNSWDTASNFQDVYTNDGDIIRAIRVLGGVLCVWKEQRLFLLRGAEPPFVVNEVSGAPGTVGLRSVAIGADRAWYAARDGDGRVGIYTYAHGQGAVPISEPIRATLETVNGSAADKIACTFWNHRLYVDIPTGMNAYPDTRLVFDTTLARDGSLGAWYPPQSLGGTAFAVYRVSGADTLHWASATGTPRVLKVPAAYDDEGAAYAGYGETADDRFASAGRRGRITLIEVDASGSGSLQVAYALDGSDMWTGTASITLATARDVQRIPANAIGESVRYRFYDNTTGGQFTVHGIVAYAADAGRVQ